MLNYDEYESPSGNKFIRRTNEDGSVTFIPADPANSDYQAYLASLQAPQANSTES